MEQSIKAKILEKVSAGLDRIEHGKVIVEVRGNKPIDVIVESRDRIYSEEPNRSRNIKTPQRIPHRG